MEHRKREGRSYTQALAVALTLFAVVACATFGASIDGKNGGGSGSGGIDTGVNGGATGSTSTLLIDAEPTQGITITATLSSGTRGVSVSALDASDTQKGVSTLSVAPAAPTAPKAVGDNDPRNNVAPAAGTRGNVAAVNAGGTAWTSIDEGTATDQALFSLGANTPGAFRALVATDIDELITLAQLSDVTITGGAAGDIIYRNAGNTAWANLAAGTNGFFLTLSGGAPAWVTITELLTLAQLSDVTVTPAAGQIIYRNAGNTAWVALNAASDGDFLTLASGVPAWTGAAAASISTEVELDGTFATTDLRFWAGSGITVTTLTAGTTRDVTITAAGGSTFTGDMNDTTQEFLNNSGAAFGGAVAVNDVFELNVTAATNPTTLTAAAATLTINVDGATGTLVLDSGDAFSVAKITGNGGSVAINETAGIALAIDNGTVPTTLVPAATTLTINVDGATGSLILDSGDSFQVNKITGGGAAVSVNETNGLDIASDSGTNAASLVVSAATLTINVSTVGGTLNLGTSDIMGADFLQTVSNNTTLTLTGRGTGGVTFGTEPVLISNLDGAGGSDANGDTPQRIGGKYLRTPLGTAGQVATVNAGATGWTFAAPTITANTTGTSSPASTLIFRGEVDGLLQGSTLNVTYANIPGVGVTEAVSRTTADIVRYTAESLCLGGTSGTTGTRILRSVDVSPSKATAGPAANGRDQAGAFGNNVWTYLWVIAKEDKAAAPAGLWSLSATTPTMPDGYFYRARVHQANTDAAGFRPHVSNGRSVSYLDAANNLALAAGAATSSTSVSLAQWIPPVSRVASLAGIFRNTLSAGSTALSSIDDGSSSYFLYSGVANTFNSATIEIPTGVSQTIYYQNGAANGELFLNVVGYRW